MRSLLISTYEMGRQPFGLASAAAWLRAAGAAVTCLDASRDSVTDDTLAFALHKMDGGGYRHLPVLKDGQPLGMISVRDMLRHITRLCKDR